MKKILASLIVLALVAPAMADVAVTAVDNGGGELVITITPSGGAVVRGVALLLGTNYGDGQAASASVTGLNTNIDFYVDNPIVDADENNVPDDPGQPAADPAGPGEATLPSADLSLCSGYLDAGGAQGGLPGIATFTVNYNLTTETEVSIALDTLRGGIVGDDLGTVDVQATQILAPGGDPCYDLLTAGEQADYLAYVAEGADPSCWCWAYQCRGDANHDTQGALTKYRVYTNDLNKVIANWKAKIATADPCADVKHDSQGALTKYRVYTNDLNEIIANWKKKDAGLVVCPSSLE